MRAWREGLNASLRQRGDTGASDALRVFYEDSERRAQEISLLPAAGRLRLLRAWRSELATRQKTDATRADPQLALRLGWLDTTLGVDIQFDEIERARLLLLAATDLILDSASGRRTDPTTGKVIELRRQGDVLIWVSPNGAQVRLVTREPPNDGCNFVTWWRDVDAALPTTPARLPAATPTTPSAF